MRGFGGPEQPLQAEKGDRLIHRHRTAPRATRRSGLVLRVGQRAGERRQSEYKHRLAGGSGTTPGTEGAAWWWKWEEKSRVISDAGATGGEEGTGRVQDRVHLG